MGFKDGSFGRYPLVTFALVAVMATTYGYLRITGAGTGADSESAIALERARTFYEQNPQVQITPSDRAVLGRAFVDVVAEAYAREQASGTGPVFSERMRERNQLRFEAVMEEAVETRRKEFPPWRWGVAAGPIGPANYVTYAFVHESAVAVGLSLLFFAVAGIGLETAWGSLLFGIFCLVSTLLPAVVFRLFDGATGGVPMSGASALVAAVLGAYLVRGLGGRFAVPGWLLLPIWAFVEYFFVREIWIENWHTAPLTTHGAALATGVGFALAVRAFGVEKKLVERSDPSRREAGNPALGRARVAVQQGDPAQALQILRSAHAESPKDREVAEAWWDLAKEHGQADEAAPAILPIMREEMRRGATADASKRWLDLSLSGAEFTVEATLAIRIGESLLDEGHPEEALAALRRAVEHPSGLSTALAQRVVRVARDLDPGVTQQAASIALQDRELDPGSRAELESLAAEVRTAAPVLAEPVAPPAEVPTVAPSSPPPPIEDDFSDIPLDPDIDLHNTADLTDPDEYERLALGEAPAGSEVGVDSDAIDPDAIDPNALSISSLEAEFSGDLSLDDTEELTGSAPSGWLDESALGGLDEAGGDPAPALLDHEGLSDDHLDNSHLEAGALSSDALSQEADRATEPELPPLPAPEPAAAVPAAAASDSIPLSSAPLSAAAEESPPAAAASTAAPAAAPNAASAAAPAAVPADVSADIPDEVLGVGGGLRPLKVVKAVPLSLEEGGLEVKIEGRAATRIPFGRIQALSVAAVAGLASKPVLVIDLVLNWTSSTGEPLKLIRLQSNGFNPLRFVPGAASPLAAIKELAARLLEGSGATPLPGSEAVAGKPFANFANAGQYQREVLNADE